MTHDHSPTHDHTARRVERHCDVLVVGGSAAGLAATLQLSRQRRSVIVVDAGEPRNAPSAHMHSFLGYEGRSPSELTRAGRAEVQSYGAEVLDGHIDQVTRDGDVFRAQLLGGASITARRVLIATGVVDQLPDIDGLAEHWGRGVIHCPFCHGYEARDQRIVQIITHPMGLHPTPLFRQLSQHLTVLVHDSQGVSAADLDGLAAAGVSVVHDRATRLLSAADGSLCAVELEQSPTLVADVVAIAPRFQVPVEPFSDLGIQATAHPSGLGDMIETDHAGATSVPGVWAAGNATEPNQQVLLAAADGSMVGAMISFDLAREEFDGGRRLSANELDWNHRYAGERMWSGNPNGALVAEMEGFPPGTALDVGAGEGGDAVWLAEHGWTVTASDISTTALAGVETEAQRRGLPIECLHADANDVEPFGQRQFDLVSAHYASIPRTRDERAAHNLVDAVSPGGVLLVVSHDLEPMRTPIDTRATSRSFDPDAYVRVEDIARILADDAAWTIEVNEKRPRPAGAASASHHVDDIVLRARRSAI